MVTCTHHQQGTGTAVAQDSFFHLRGSVHYFIIRISTRTAPFVWTSSDLSGRLHSPSARYLQLLRIFFSSLRGSVHYPHLSSEHQLERLHLPGHPQISVVACTHYQQGTYSCSGFPSERICSLLAFIIRTSTRTAPFAWTSLDLSGPLHSPSARYLQLLRIFFSSLRGSVHYPHLSSEHQL